MPDIIRNLIEADILIYLVPVHAFGMAHPMQIFLERAGVGYLRFERPLANKIGGCIIIGRRYNLGNVHDQIINNFLLNRLIIPGAGYPALIQGGESGDVLQDIEGLASVDTLINRLCNVAEALQGVKYTDFANERKMVEIKEKNNKNWIHYD
jgi:multimeric flavodoxin WrbA